MRPRTKLVLRILATVALSVVAVVIAVLAATHRRAIVASETRPQAPPATAVPPGGEFVYTPPNPATIPEGPLGNSIRRGLALVTQTHELLPDHVGNDLHCTSCHLEGGTKAGAAPWVGLPAVFPEFRARSGRVDPLERRINDCFERSMNGTALDPTSDDMTAILAYMAFISRGVPAGVTPGRGFRRIANAPTPDREAGRALFATQCATCHGANGEGRTNQNAYLFPPLGGARSFNLGAGMARLDNAASFIRWNMPLGRGGSLDDAQAYAIADYMIHLDRPDWSGKDRDWPAGGRPRDARY